MNRFAIVASLVVSSFFIVACHQDKPAEGPAERAGQKVDQAADKTKQASKKAADDTKEAAQDTKKDIEKKTDKN